ncbi:methylmalonyl-CoA epimerase [Albibacterium sp.]|uniref:methylmalonyl-CoA epimerase n=1 Tax=Albibacterium sp. TaxID=2952885 RepID=UPI002C37D8CF|nr:methylmalonyl-CoA epimerase [Albibacterium sp.]HUH18752.1 methylmalonyl-CoA epimerase [Albibacterium sp.]
MEKIEHIGIAVKDLDQAIKNYEQLLQSPCYKTETVESEYVKTAFFKVGESKIELLQALNNEGPIHQFIEKRGEGMHHIAYEVEDIKKEMARLKETGSRLLNEEPKKGADDKWVCFIHPKDNNGVLTELVQSISTSNL